MRTTPTPPGHTRVVVRETALDVPNDQLHQLPALQGHMHAPYYPARWDPWDVAGVVTGTVLPVVTLFLLFAGFNHVNQPAPETGPATFWYTLAVACGVGGIVVAVLGDASRAAIRLGIAASIALPLGLVLGGILQDLYGAAGWFILWFTPVGWVLFGFTFLAWLAVGITALVMGNSRGGRTGADIALAGGLGLAWSSAGAAAYFLLTLPAQAEKARIAHETPGVGLALLALAVLGAALVARRR